MRPPDKSLIGLINCSLFTPTSLRIFRSIKTEFSLETKLTCTQTYEQYVSYNQHVHAKNKGCPHDHLFNGEKLSCMLDELIEFVTPDPDVSNFVVADLLVLNKNAQLGHHIMEVNLFFKFNCCWTLDITNKTIN